MSAKTEARGLHARSRVQRDDLARRAGACARCNHERARTVRSVVADVDVGAADADGARVRDARARRRRLRRLARRAPGADPAHPDADGDRARAPARGVAAGAPRHARAHQAHRRSHGGSVARAAQAAAVRRVHRARGGGARRHLAQVRAAGHGARRLPRRHQRPRPRARGQQHHPGDAGLLGRHRRRLCARGRLRARHARRPRRRARR